MMDTAIWFLIIWAVWFPKSLAESVAEIMNAYDRARANAEQEGGK